MLRDGAAEIVVGSDGIDLDALIGGEFTELLAAGPRQVERVAVRALAVDFHTLVSEFPGASDHLFHGQGVAAIPDAAVGDAVEADLDVGRGSRFGSREGAGCGGGLDESAAGESGHG